MRGAALLPAIASLSLCACAHLEIPPETAERAVHRCVEGHAEEVPDTAFWTDGRSAWPDGSWQACCIEHDMAYWCGGSAAERAAADRVLRGCVGGGMLGWTMWSGVRMGGHLVWPLPWRWGYGRSWPALYASPPEPAGGAEAPK